MDVKETKVRLSAKARARIEALVGPNRMADFIRQAVDNELDRREVRGTGEGRAPEPERKNKG